MVNELVKLYGGTIAWRSDLHKGTQFTILLPVFNNQFAPSINRGSTSPVHMPEYTADVNEELIEGEATSENHPDTILVVEDNADLRNFIAASLRGQFTILTAKDGQEGVAVAADHIPDLIISDVMMPLMDGIALTESIKADERTNHVPVILLTAKADLASRLEGLHTGVDDYLSKPFSTEELRARVTNLIEQRKKLAAKYRAAALQPAPSGETSLDDKFVLRARMVVEANIDNSAFGVEMMADEMSLSRTQLFRKLKAISGLSPNEFINDIRLQRAADLIRAKADTLTQISYSVGYSEQSYFAKRFRKKFGVTPSEYQTTQASD
jgi:YesN/AraC family two-component response regulator